MRVLVIEDDRETAQFLQRSLKENGHVADLAAELQRFLEIDFAWAIQARSDPERFT